MLRGTTISIANVQSIGISNVVRFNFNWKWGLTNILGAASTKKRKEKAVNTIKAVLEVKMLLLKIGMYLAKALILLGTQCGCNVRDRMRLSCRKSKTKKILINSRKRKCIRILCNKEVSYTYY